MIKQFGLSFILVGSLLFVGYHAQAQGFAPRPGGSPTPRANSTTEKKGPAEAAPEDDSDAAEANLPALPSWPGIKEKKLLFFEMHGYFRFRTDMMNNLNLGQRDVALESGIVRSPYWVPLVENSEKLNCAARISKSVPGGGSRDLSADDCPDNTLTGANIRFRLEPTLNVSEKVRIHAQLDIFDNLVMGSTPDSIMGQSLSPHTSMGFFTESQDTPIVGRNSNIPSILVKRAWAEADTPLGELKVGRMPWHWGMGLLANGGSCWDCNYGDNVDRMAFKVDWADHSFGAAYDFAGTGPDSYKIDLNSQLVGSQTFAGGGQAIDLEQLDDIDQVVLFAGRFDRPDVIKDKLLRKEIVLNYGALFVWRKQNMDFLSAKENQPANANGLNSTEADLAANLREISAYTVTGDIWFKLMWRRLSVEFEGILTMGEIGNVSDTVDGEDVVDISQWGFVLRTQYGFLKNSALKLRFEVGVASGDDDELYDLNRRRSASALNTTLNRKIRELRFDPDYHVDLILFREIMGGVANAIYFKPSLQYDIFDSLGFRFDTIYSLAQRPLAYPGNSRHLGLEFDFDLYYKNVDEGFYAGLQYGILAPLGALDRPEEIFGTNEKLSEVAQTLQARVIVKF